MDKGIKTYVQKCSICQIQKRTRIIDQAEGIILDIPTKTNEKITFDIFGVRTETEKENKYIVSLQDRLTRYMILMLLPNKTTSTIIENLIEHYIYIFEAPKKYSYPPRRKIYTRTYESIRGSI